MKIQNLLNDLQKNECNNNIIYSGYKYLMENGKKTVDTSYKLKTNSNQEFINEIGNNVDFGNCLAVFPKLIPDLYVIDFDTLELADCPIYKMLIEDEVYHTKSISGKGYHFYIKIDGLADYKCQIKLGIKVKEIDLLKNQWCWEKKDSDLKGKKLMSYNWETIKHMFNVNRMNIKDEKISLGIKDKVLNKNINIEGSYSSEDEEEVRCGKEQFIDYLNRLSPERYNYEDWCKIGMICYNNFEDLDEGYDIWREWTNKDEHFILEHNHRNRKYMNNKYDSFDEQRNPKLTYRTLRKWANEDNPLNPFEEAFKKGGDDALVMEMNKYCLYVRDIGNYIILNNNEWYLKKSGEANEYFDKYTFITKSPKGNDKVNNVFNTWRKNIKRREVDKIVYDPDPSSNEKEVFNIWKGYAIKYEDVKTHEGSCQLLLDHILYIWCQGNSDHFNYVLDWLAFKLQYPHKKIGTVICLKSQEGAGKGLVFRFLQKIIGNNHYASISNINSIIGDFNGMSEGRQLIDLDEAVWGGNKQLEGRLKHIITEEEQVINKKNKEAYVIDNYCDYFMTTNEDWFAPVNENSRRFFCLELDNKIAGFNLTKEQREYIDKIRNEDVNAFAKILYERDLSKFNPRQFVKTKLLQDQVEHSWNSAVHFWKEKLENQGIDEELWNNPDSLDSLKDGTVYYNKKWVFDRYKEWDGGSYSRKLSNPKFWKQTQDIFDFKSGRLTSGDREYYICMPDIEEARELFNKFEKYDYEYPEIIPYDIDSSDEE